MGDRYRVVQWATGNIGRRALPAIIAHPELELVGLWVHSEEKVGKDAGELAGVDPVGVAATNDVDALLALEPDCVCFMASGLDTDLIARMLRSGINVVTTSGGFLSGRNWQADSMAKLQQAAIEGGATMVGTGFDPGYAPILTGFLTAPCRKVYSARFIETLDATTYPVPAAWESLGFGQPAKELSSGPFTADDDVRAPDVPGFFDSLDVMAEMMEVELERKEWSVERALATEDIDAGWMQFPKGTVAAQKRSYAGYAHGRPVVSLEVIWAMSFDTIDRDWEHIEGYRIEIEGEPRVVATVAYEPSTVEGLSDETSAMGVLLVGTAMPAVQAIPFVCAAPPGLMSPAKLPLIGARHMLV